MWNNIYTFISKTLLRSRSDEAYAKAKEQLRAIHRRMNSNIPDYNPFELPDNRVYVKYPKEGTKSGKVFQKCLKTRADFKVIVQRHEECGQLFKHTHYGFYEFIYIVHGTFLDINDVPYIKGDAIFLNGFNPHSLKCLTETGMLLVAFSATKTKLNINTLLKYLEHESYTR